MARSAGTRRSVSPSAAKRKTQQTRRKRRERDEHDRTVHALRQLIEEGDRKRLEAERAANALLTVSLCELSDKSARFAAEPWREAAADPQWSTWIRCEATAIKSYVVREQAVAKAMHRLHARAPTPSVARCIYSSAHARDLLAWLEKQRCTAARDSILVPLRRAVVRKHAFSIIFNTH